MWNTCLLQPTPGTEQRISQLRYNACSREDFLPGLSQTSILCRPDEGWWTSKTLIGIQVHELIDYPQACESMWREWRGKPESGEQRVCLGRKTALFCHTLKHGCWPWRDPAVFVFKMWTLSDTARQNPFAQKGSLCPDEERCKLETTGKRENDPQQCKQVLDPVGKQRVEEEGNKRDVRDHSANVTYFT